MATSFTETATLRVVDESTAAIKKINDALKALQKTAKGLKSQTINLKGNVTAAEKLAKAPKQLAQNLNVANKAQAYLSKQTRELQRATDKAQIKEQRALKQKDRVLKEQVRVQEKAQRKEQQALKEKGRLQEQTRRKEQQAVQQAMRLEDQGRKKAAQATERAAKQKETVQAKEEKAHLRSLEKKQREGEKAAAKQIRDADKTAKAQAQAATRAQGEIDKAARTANTERVRQERVDARVRREAERAAARPTVLGAAGRGAGRFLRGAAAGAVGLTGYGTTLTGTGAAIGRAGQIGAVGADIGESKLRLKQLTDDRRKLADKEIQAVEMRMRGMPAGQFHTKGDIQDLYAEVLGVLREGAVAGQTRMRDPITGRQTGRVLTDVERRQNLEATHRAAGGLVEEAKDLELHLFTLGKPLAEARKGSLSYVKALEQQNVLTDPKTGAYSPERAKTAFTFLHKLIDTIGEEATGEFYRQNIRYLKSSKFGLSQDDMQGIALASFAGEEMKTTAAVGIHQMIKQGTGVGIQKSAIREQVALGLMVAQYGPPIKKGPNKGKRAIISAESVDPELMRKDPLGFMEKYTVPAFEKRFREELSKGTKGTKGKPGVKGLTGDALDEAVAKAMQDPNKIQGLFNKMYSHSAAAGMASDVFLRMSEYRQLWEDFQSRSGERGVIREAASKSVRVQAQAMTNQFQGALGQTILAIAPEVQGLTEGITKKMAEYSDVMQRAREGDPEAKRLVAGGTALAGLTAVAGGFALSKLGGVLGTIAPVIGTTAGVVAAATATTAQETSMANAGISLNQAGSALQTAAAMLMGKGLIPTTGGGGADVPDKGKPGEKPGTGRGRWRRIGGRVGGRLLGGGLIAGGVLAVSEFIAWRAEQEEKISAQMEENFKTLEGSTTELFQTDRAIGEEFKKLNQANKAQKPAIQQIIQALQAKRAAIMARIKELTKQTQALEATVTVPTGIQTAIDAAAAGADQAPVKAKELLRQAAHAFQMAKAALIQQRLGRPPEDWSTTTPKAPLNWVPPWMMPGGKAPTFQFTPGMFPKGIPIPGVEKEDEGEGAGGPAAAAEDGAAKFAEAFSTGASLITAAGTDAGNNLGSTATSVLLGGASAAGNTLGAAAVAAIQAGVSNINITANVKVDGAPNKTGTVKEGG